MRNKKFNNIFIPHLLFIISLITDFYGDIPTFIEKEFNINIQNIILGLIIIIFYIYLLFNVHSDLGVNREKVKTKLDKIINIILIIIINLYIIITFIPNPNFIENWANFSNSLTSTQTITGTKPYTQTLTPDPNGTALQTETIQPPTSTSISTLTPTPTLTLTPTPTPTPINYAINVCVFDLGLDENNEPIVKTNVDNLERLGFNVKIINIDEKSSYDGCQVLYLSDGWISLRSLLIDQTYLNQVMDKMSEYGGPGLLIGNPGKNYGTYTFKFYDDITFISLSTEEIAKMGSSKIYVDRESDLYNALLKDIGDSDADKEMLPEPESKVVPNLNATKSYWPLVVNENYHYYALVSSGITGPRYLIMPGGEFSSADPIPDYLYERLIKWLARIPIN